MGVGRASVRGSPALRCCGEARLTPDQPGALQCEYHLVNRGRAHLEVALDIGLGWRPAVDPHVGIDEGQVLTLRVGEAGLRKRHPSDRRFIWASFEEEAHEHTLPCRPERGRAL